MGLGKDDLLTRKEASAYLEKIGCPVSAPYLAILAANQNTGDKRRPHGPKGPPFIKVLDKIVRYKRCDLDDWALKAAKRFE